MNAQRSPESPETVKVFVSILLGVLIGSVVCDVTSVSSDVPSPHELVALYSMAGGFFGGLFSAGPAVLHLLSRAEDQLSGPASTCLWIDLLTLTLYAAYIRMRAVHDSVTGEAQKLSVTAIVMLHLSEWLRSLRARHRDRRYITIAIVDSF